MCVREQMLMRQKLLNLFADYNIFKLGARIYLGCGFISLAAFVFSLFYNKILEIIVYAGLSIFCFIIYGFLRTRYVKEEIEELEFEDENTINTKVTELE